jgi:hypothetical protein
MQKIKWIFPKLKHVSKLKFQNVKIKWTFFQKLKHGSKVTFQTAKRKQIFVSKIKTWFQGENLKCRNKMISSKKQSK